jgi:ABC-type uncharacterized transport system involved in gliding motility auxiliary subunit
MRKALPFVAPVGLAVMAGAWVFTLTGRPLPGQLGVWLTAGFALVLLHLVLAWEDIDRAVGRRQLRYGANMVVLSLAFLGILVLLNWVVYGNSKRWDLTESRKFTLSEQSLKVLGGLKEDVRVLYFQTRARMAEPGNDAVQNMKKFEEASRRVKVEFVDPQADPGKAQEYDVTSVPTLVLVRGERREKVYSDSEQDLANALVKVTREGQKTVCFLEGEGERSPDDVSPRGLSGFKQGLERNQYKTRQVSLLQAAAVPADCSALVVAGPQRDLPDQGVAALRGYVKQGGRALVMLDLQPKEPVQKLEALLGEWNVMVGAEAVLYPSNVQAAFGRFVALAAVSPSHEIVKDLDRLSVAFPLARPVEPGASTAEGLSAQTLLRTDELAYAEKNATAAGLQAADYDQGERRGPLSLAVTVTMTSQPVPAASPSPSASPAQGEAGSRSEGRAVVFGTPDVASNLGLTLPVVANGDVALNAVAWLVQDSDLITIRPRDPEDQRLALAPGPRILWALFSLLVLPGACILAGIVSWWRRRG